MDNLALICRLARSPLHGFLGFPLHTASLSLIPSSNTNYWFRFSIHSLNRFPEASFQMSRWPTPPQLSRTFVLFSAVSSLYQAGKFFHKQRTHLGGFLLSGIIALCCLFPTVWKSVNLHILSSCVIVYGERLAQDQLFYHSQQQKNLAFCFNTRNWDNFRIYLDVMFLFLITAFTTVPDTQVVNKNLLNKQSILGITCSVIQDIFPLLVIW